mgnify:CR=1 FL=1
MAIVKMKKLRLAVMAGERKALLKDLLLLGCVEFSEPSELESAGFDGLRRCASGDLAVQRANYALLTDAIKLMDRYAPAKGGFLKPLPEAKVDSVLDERELPADLAMAEKITGKEEQIRRCTSETARLESAVAALSPWLDLDVPLGCKGTEKTVFATASLPAAADMTDVDAALGAAAPESQLFRVSGDKSLNYVALICYADEYEAAQEALRPYGFNLMSPGDYSGTAREETAKAELKIRGLGEQKQRLMGEIAQLASHRSELKLRADTISTKIARSEAEEKLMGTESTVLLQGWLPAEREEELGRVLGKYDCAWETAEPTEDEYPDVPVKLKNNRLTRALNMVTEMYSLPAYNNVDPNPLMAPFFILFYGIMLADMGYGVLMIAAAVVVLAKAKPRKGMRNFFELMLWCGISTTIWGAITGGLFSDAPLQIARIINPDTTWQGLPALFTPLNDTIMILIGAMCLGFVQIITGMVVSVTIKVRRGEIFSAVFEEGTWWVIFAGIACLALGVGSIGGVPVVLAIGVVMLFIGSAKGKKGFGIISGFIGAIYNGVTGYFGDILSYSRLMALMLAGSVIAQVFNTIGAIAGNIFVFLLISIVGNALNFALNLLGCFVHDLRLQCLEYFGKFYEDGGKPFRPLEINTQYVTVTNTDK